MIMFGAIADFGFHALMPDHEGDSNMDLQDAKHQFRIAKRRPNIERYRELDEDQIAAAKLALDFCREVGREVGA